MIKSALLNITAIILPALFAGLTSGLPANTPIAHKNLSPVPDTPAICLVTVDTAIVKNVVVWEKIPGQHIAFYKIYKEKSGINNWDSIGFRPYDSLSYFVDSTSNPIIKSAKYRISAVDSSGNESAKSPIHRTINLIINKTTGWTFELVWTPYEGFNVDYYRIWRWSFGNGWKKIDSVQGNIHTYTDNPPPGLVYYFVETAPPHPCNVTKAQTNYNTSRSNRTNTSVYLYAGKPHLNDNVAVFPNPASGIVNIVIKGSKTKYCDIALYSLQGFCIFTAKTQQENQYETIFKIDPAEYALRAGIYILKIRIDDYIYTKKLVLTNK